MYVPVSPGRRGRCGGMGVVFMIGAILVMVGIVACMVIYKGW